METFSRAHSGITLVKKGNTGIKMGMSMKVVGGMR